MPPGPPPPPPGPPPPPPGPPPDAAIVLTLQGSVLTSNMITPTVRLNGYPVPARYGDNHYPVPSGRWHLDVAGQWLRTYGQAAIDVDLHPGQSAHVFYAAPLHQFSTGSIGFEKQSRKGLGTFVAILSVIVLVVLAIAVLPAVL